MKEHGVEDNRHTKATLETLAQEKQSSIDALADKRQKYTEELEKQRHHDDRRKNFSTKAKEFVDWIEHQVKTINELEGTSEEKIQKVHSLYNPEVGNTHIAELEHIDQENVSNGIFGNKHTPLTLGSLKARNAQFNQFVENTLESLNEDTKVQQKTKRIRRRI